MLFNSFSFFFFFPLVALLFFILPTSKRWLLMLISSYIFYIAWNPIYILLILTSTIVDYFIAQKIADSDSTIARKRFLWLSLATNLSLLFTFKYFDFLSTSVQSVFTQFGSDISTPILGVLLPVGISFYTFQTLSYTIDVYNGRIEPERNLGIFALFVSFWPQLVAGPIERADRLLPQLRTMQSFDYLRIRSGLTRMLWGFFKKMVIADRIAIYVDAIYSSPSEFGRLPLLVATLLFAIQIYCDFSGYSDIAIGAAKVFGVDLMENFRTPYLSRSIPEFWRRWHISLSTWFRDYVYIPLGGSRVVKWRWYYNLAIVFIVSGLWHGANWTFVIWGTLHAVYMVVTMVLNEFVDKLEGEDVQGLSAITNVFQWLLTLLLVCFAWIFFRASTVQDSFTIVGNLLFSSGLSNELPAPNGSIDWYILLFAIFILGCQDWFLRNTTIEAYLPNKSVGVRWSYYLFMSACILWFGVFTTSQFIYFQF